MSFGVCTPAERCVQNVSSGDKAKQATPFSKWEYLLAANNSSIKIKANAKLSTFCNHDMLMLGLCFFLRFVKHWSTHTERREKSGRERIRVISVKICSICFEFFFLSLCKCVFGHRGLFRLLLFIIIIFVQCVVWNVCSICLQCQSLCARASNESLFVLWKCAEPTILLPFLPVHARNNKRCTFLLIRIFVFSLLQSFSRRSICDSFTHRLPSPRTVYVFVVSFYKYAFFVGKKNGRNKKNTYSHVSFVFGGQLSLVSNQFKND